MDKDILNSKVNLINEIIYRYLPHGDSYDSELTSAMAYAVQAGGKRLRPMLMQETYHLFAKDKAETELLHSFMAAIEFIHTYSLVHDDLPAMDDDDLRRGQLTVHRKYGEAAGILTGDALLNHAFEIILTGLEGCGSSEIKNGIHAAAVLASKAGVAGMVGGQYLDVYSEKHTDFKVDSNSLDYIYRNKTSALLDAAMMAGAILGGADEEEKSVMHQIANDIGMAFQIRDDILDITGDQVLLGKPVGSDERNYKQTFVSIYGLAKAQETVREYSANAVKALDSLKYRSDFLRELIETLVKRES